MCVHMYISNVNGTGHQTGLSFRINWFENEMGD